MLLHVISHDLKEPLRAIENFSSMIYDRYQSQLDERGQDLLQRVVKAAIRMRLLLDDIVNLSRARLTAKRFERVNGEELIQEAMSRLKSTIEKTGAAVRVEHIPSFVVDRIWAVQAIYNLVSNALKFTQEGQAPDIEIAPYVSSNGNTHGAGIVVRDRGPGVAPEHAERIFELFQRAVGREIEGTGAGLAIVWEVAKRHDGSAWVQPRPGGGSEFIVTFGTHQEKVMHEITE